MKKLKVTAYASIQSNTFLIDFEDLGITEQEYDAMLPEEQQQLINEYVNENRELPSWVIEQTDIEKTTKN